MKARPGSCGCFSLGTDTQLRICFLFFSSLWRCPLLLSASPPLWTFSLHFLPVLPCAPVPTDELYAQKLKYKAISEELDHALNDMTSL